MDDTVRIEIIEQPAPNKLRFRYESEGRGAGALQGTNSSESHRTFPTIRIHGTQYPAIVIVSCVEHEPDKNGHYRTHPHKLGNLQILLLFNCLKSNNYVVSL